MPFCPKCRAEYEYGFAKCAECDVPLVNQLLIEQQKENNFIANKQAKEELNSSVVYLCTVDNELEAILLRDLLKQAGIESSCRLKSISRYPRMLAPDYTGFGRNDIMVLDNDYDTANKIVDEYFESFETTQSPPQENQDNETQDE